MGEGRGKDAFWKKNNSEWGLWDNQPAWSQISGLGQVEGQAAVIEEGFPHENWLKTRKKKLFFLVKTKRIPEFVTTTPECENCGQIWEK